MEIEKKYRVKVMPDNLSNYQKKEIEQGYLCKKPVVRIRKSNDDYILTYKSKFGLNEQVGQHAKVSNEVEVPLNKSGYEHLKTKIDNHLVTKTRHLIPLEDGLTAELDVFHGVLSGLIIVEVEFISEEQAAQFVAPDWFGEDVSKEERFSNNYLCTLDAWSESL